jgi:hypothetical protein
MTGYRRRINAGLDTNIQTARERLYTPLRSLPSVKNRIRRTCEFPFRKDLVFAENSLHTLESASAEAEDRVMALR